MKQSGQDTGSFPREKSNIIHVNFFGSRENPRHEAQLRPSGASFAKVARFERRRQGMPLAAPWVLRLLALMGILILSLFVL